MPAKPKKTKARLRLEAADIRVQDLAGGMWTVPVGTRLHETLVDELELGYLVPVVRQGDLRAGYLVQDVMDVDWGAAADGTPGMQAVAVRAAEYARLVERVRARRRAEFRGL